MWSPGCCCGWSLDGQGSGCQKGRHTTPALLCQHDLALIELALWSNVSACEGCAVDHHL